MRKRTKNFGLPSGIQVSRGKYYRVVKNKWIPLGGDLEKAVEISKNFNPQGVDKNQIGGWIVACHKRARQNAKGRRKIEFNLTEEEVKELLEECNWRCSVTGVEFTHEIVAGKKPFAPSIDRIDSSKGYTKDNCRIVCVAANYAMNVWGDGVLKRMLKSMWKSAFPDIKRPEVLDGF